MALIIGLAIGYSCLFQVSIYGEDIDYTKPTETIIATEPNFEMAPTESEIPAVTVPIIQTNPTIPKDPLKPSETVPSHSEEELKWIARAEEYPVATKVWLFLKEELGYSDYVCAGIVGNMMTECGGQTLKLDWTALNKRSGCYGLCQWHPKYFPELQGADLEAQLEFMKASFPSILSKYMGRRYQKGFTYEDFLSLEDPKLVAYIFCVVYENPGPGAHTRRQENAMKAYEYFTS